MKRSNIPAVGSTLPNGRTLALLHSTWYAGEGEIPHTIILATNSGVPHPYAVWDLVYREDDSFSTVCGSYFENDLEAIIEYRRRTDLLQATRAGCEVELS